MRSRFKTLNNTANAMQLHTYPTRPRKKNLARSEKERGGLVVLLMMKEEGRRMKVARALE